MLVIDANLPYSIDFLTDIGIPIYEVNNLSEAIAGSFIRIRVPTILLVDANGVIQDVYTND